MAKGLKIKHTCTRCDAVRMISKVAACRRGGTRCIECGGNMEPSAAGWDKLAEAETARREVRSSSRYVWQGDDPDGASFPY